MWLRRVPKSVWNGLCASGGPCHQGTEIGNSCINKTGEVQKGVMKGPCLESVAILPPYLCRAFTYGCLDLNQI